jgi:hypothetical protein
MVEKHQNIAKTDRFWPIEMRYSQDIHEDLVIWRFSFHAGIAGWFAVENQKMIWMRTRGTSILGPPKYHRIFINVMGKFWE